MKEWNDLQTVAGRPTKKMTRFISVYKGGVISFNSKMMRDPRFKGRKTSHVILSYTPSGNAIVFEFTNDKSDPGAKRLTPTPTQTVCSGAQLFTKFNIDAKEVAGRYQPIYERVAEKGVCCILQFKEGRIK